MLRASPVPARPLAVLFESTARSSIRSGCDRCERHKPHPEPVLTALLRLGYKSDEAVLVGDSVHDVAAGNRVGVKTVAALWGPFIRRELAVASPDEFLEQITELPQLLAGR